MTQFVLLVLILILIAAMIAIMLSLPSAEAQINQTYIPVLIEDEGMGRVINTPTPKPTRMGVWPTYTAEPPPR